MQFFRMLSRTIVKISEIMGFIAIISLLIMMMLTVFDVTGRYFFSRPVLGCTEITELLMVCVGFLGLALCALQDRHVKIDILVNLFPERVQKILHSFNFIVVVVVTAFISWQTFIEAPQVHRKTLLLNIPQSPFYSLTGFSYLMMSLIAIVLLVKSIQRMVKR